MTRSRMIVVMLIAALVFVTNAGAGAAAEDVTFIGSYDAGIASYVTVSGNYAYVIDATNGLVIVDVSDKEQPMLAGSCDAKGWSVGVAVSGDYAYVASGSDGLAIVDVSNAKAPELAGTYDATPHVETVIVSGDYAYMTDTDDGLMIVDVSDAEAPKLAGIL